MPDDPIFELPPQQEPYTGDVMYERQAELGLQTDMCVAIVGCGGVGSWAALALAMGGIKELLLFDGDTVSLNNLNRLPLPAQFIGQPKSLALQVYLQSLRPKLEIVARGNLEPKLHADISKGTEYYLSWVVCCTDSLKSRQMCKGWADTIGAAYLELGADGERWTLSPEPPEFTTASEADPGYASVPIHVGPCMMAGAAAAYYVLHGQRPTGSHMGEWQAERHQVADNVDSYPSHLHLAYMSEIATEIAQASDPEWEEVPENEQT